MTTQVATYKTIVIEDLDVGEIHRERRVARAVADIGLFEFRRQLEYKAKLFGSTVVVDKWFASSKRCSSCGQKNRTLGWVQRVWKCKFCEASHNRDVNAAQFGVVRGEFTRVSLWSRRQWR